jgi:3-hydroxyisobutyrate dehydrogenase-like beta-hydroxyacid dehydrogenase
MKVGWIGLGNMGMPMARNLIKAGHELTAYNRTRSRTEELGREGARVAASPAEAASVPILFTSLADDQALEEVILGPGQVLKTLGPGAIHVSTSTISVALAEQLSEAHLAAGQILVSAPVFGRPEAAAAAKLFVVVAGPSEALKDLQPLFDAIGQRTFVVGDVAPKANVVKLSGNFLIASVIESLAEAFTLVRKYGVDPRQYLDLLTNSLFAAPVYRTYGKLILDDEYGTGGFRLKLGLKDVRLTLAAGEAAAVPLPLASLVRDHLLAAMAKGLQDADWAAFARIAAENAGLKPTSPGN